MPTRRIPPKPPEFMNPRKDTLVQFRTTRQERDRLTIVALKRGMSLSRFLRIVTEKVKK